MKVALIAVHIEESPRAVPLGAAMVASVLNNKFSGQITTQIFDFYLKQSEKKCAELIVASKAGYVGLSMYVWNRQFIINLCRELKSQSRDLIIFLGGPEATANYDQLIEFDEIDFIIKGEGELVAENVFRAILNKENIKEVDSIASRSHVPNLDQLISPHLDGTLNPEKYSGMLWELSRGCPFKCDFCFESRGTHGVRRFAIENIEKELDTFIEHGVSQVFVLDPTFNYNPENAKRILNLIINKETDIHFYFEARSEFLDQELAELFSRINCSLQIGLQSADPDVLKNINRKFNPKEFKKKILLLHEAQVVYGFDLIYGLPGDNLQGFKVSMDYALDMVPNHLDIFPLSVLPATKLHDTATNFGLNYLKDEPYTVISTPSFSEFDMKEAGRISRACDLFYNHGKAVPWFSLILNSLGLLPSEFISAFADWLDANESGDKIIYEVQREFLRFIFSDRPNGKELGNVASDIAAYFGYTAMLVEGGEELNIQQKGRYRLNPNSIFVEFDYDPMMLEEKMFSGITDIKKLPRQLRKMKDKVLFYINDYELDVRVLPEEKVSLLKSFKQGRNKLPENKNEKKFIKSCMEDNIIVQVK